jgi:hypothetical protein
MSRTRAIVLFAALPSMQAAADSEGLRTGRLGPQRQWTAAVAGGGAMAVTERQAVVVKSPLPTSICFLQQVIPVEGDYALEVVVRGVRSDRTGGVFIGVCKAPIPLSGDPGPTCDANAKAHWYPYGWLGTNAGDHALVTLRAPREYLCWDRHQWVERWARTGIAISPAATYRFRLQRRDGEYRLAVLDDAGQTILAPPAVKAEAMNGGLGPDTLVIGDPWRMHTAMEMEVISVTLNDEPLGFGEPSRKLESKAATSGDEQFEVTMGEPFTISRSGSYHNFPTVKQISQQELFVAIWASPDASLPPEDCQVAVVRTDDGGRTWDDPVVFSGGEAGGHSWIRRTDGTCVWLSYFCRPTDNRTLTCSVGHSQDGMMYSWSEGTISFPEPVKPWTSGNAYMVFARSILEMGDGSLLATMYGQFEGDPKYRCLLVRSTDGGQGWDYYSTIAFDPEAPGEGYCEPVVARTTDGDLLCVMRVSSSVPMWMCRSGDDGRTWSRPKELPAYATSVFPDMVLMSNGILAVSFGRPGAHIMFSAGGEGRRWTSRTTVHEGTNTDAYTAIREVAPGRLLHVYHEATTNEAGERVNLVRGVFVDVSRRHGPS